MFLLFCSKTHDFWEYFSNWWKNITNFFLTDIFDDIQECVLFGFPCNSNDILTLNFCIIYAKYYI